MRERYYLRLEEEPVYGPDTGADGAFMREHRLGGALDSVVAHVLTYRERISPGAQVAERILPDGLARLIFTFDDAGAAAWLAGPQDSAVVLRHTRSIDSISLQLRPGAVRALFGIDAHELANRCVPWDAVAPAVARKLPDQLGEAPGVTQRMEVLQRSLLSLFRPGAPQEAQRLHAALAIARRVGTRTPVRDIARQVDIGERRLQQLFRAHVGFSPRTWSRLARIHECLRELRKRERIRWPELALDLGFYDQSHLVNEFRAICGVTPGQIRAPGIAGISKTAGARTQ